MKFFKSLLLTGATGIALFIVSCNKDSGYDSLSLNNETASATFSSCFTNSDVANTTGSSRSDYYLWSTTNKTLSGSSSPQIRFEGQYASFIRPVDTAGWYIGTVALADSCDNWDDFRDNIEVKNLSSYIGTDPNSSPFTRWNVVGARGTVGTYFFGNGGYYGYPGLGAPVIDRLVVLWKDTAGTTESFVSNPTTANTSLNATEVYIIKVDSFVPGGSGTSLTGTNNYRYRQVQ